RDDVQHHRQAAQVALHVGGLAQRELACGVERVVAPPRGVVRGEGNRFEITGRSQPGRVVGNVVGQFRYGDLGQFAADDLAFGRVVVDEHQAVQAYAEHRCDAARVAGLVLPVGDEGGDVAALERYFGVSECSLGNGWI